MIMHGKVFLVNALNVVFFKEFCTYFFVSIMPLIDLNNANSYNYFFPHQSYYDST